MCHLPAGLAFWSPRSYPGGDGSDAAAARAKDALEALAAGWSDAERAQCTAETAAAFGGGGALLKALAVM